MPIPVVILVQARVTLARFTPLPRWSVALNGAQLDPHVVEVRRIDRDTSYFVVTCKQADRITARFALSASGAVLEAEGIEQADTALEPYLASPPGQELVWMPCRQSLSRLEPFWRRTDSRIGPFLRVDGRSFDVLSTEGRG